jgi:ornithine carbamoyltransferase
LIPTEFTTEPNGVMCACLAAAEEANADALSTRFADDEQEAAEEVDAVDNDDVWYDAEEEEAAADDDEEEADDNAVGSETMR